MNKTHILTDLPDERTFQEWEQFVFSHTSGTIFQTPYYFQIFLKSEKTRPVVVLVKNEKNVINGILVCVIQYQAKSLLKYITSRSVIIGGPLVENDDPEIFGRIISAYDDFISSRVIYSQIRNLSDCNGSRLQFEAKKYNYEDHLNILVDLNKPVEELWKEVQPKRKNEIRRGEKEGLVFKPIASTDEFNSGYDILNNLYSRIKLPIYPKEVFIEAFTNLGQKNLARFFGVYFEGELIGVMFTFCYKNQTHNWFAGSEKSFYKKFPNDFLPWRIFLWAKENGFSLFDWGGAGKPGVPYGVRDYKMKFGGKMVNYGRYEKIHKPFLYSIAKLGFKLWQSLK